MADTRRGFQRRILAATLRHGRATTLLAAASVAIGVSVAAALMHVSGDVGHKVAHELRALGPNLLVTSAGSEYLDARDARARLRSAGLDGAALLYVVGSVRGEPYPVIGAEAEPMAALHPKWRVSRVGPGALAGARLLDRLHLTPGATLRIDLPGSGPRDVAIGARLEAGGADDEALWLPLADVQRATGLDGKASVMQARIDGGRDRAETVRAALERDGRLRVSVVGALTSAEAGLLERLRRIMTLVTASALVAAGLCAFGALTDRALERRRDFALLKALGAEPRAIVMQFAAEALTIGLAGGVVGSAFGLLMAQVIGHQVFHSSISVRPGVPLVVIGLALLVSVASSIGPARLALSVEPAAALKGD